MNDRYGENSSRHHRSRHRHDERAQYGARDYGRDRYEDDRGFIDRAGDEVRSWFGDEEAERRRAHDAERMEREGRISGGDSWRGETAGSGWGNQTGQSWNRDRPGTPGGWDGRRTEGYGAYGAGYGIGASGERSASRYADQGGGQGWGGDIHDPHYSEWRNRQIESLDRDYDEYRREHQSKFEQDFGNWRSRRGEQRQSMGKATENMEVVGSDGVHIGTVDKVKGDRIILTKSDQNADGRHHSIPCAWIESVDDKVIVNKSSEDAMKAWRDEEHNRALFEREDSGSDGPGILNRSFSGTY